ncbi:peptide-methionine (R)-S-oxide reductase [Pontibacter burrus]|uniref:peptide-methionine (R)-S-oxide reductase n=1 Tax=Pontibacter burrus TaxID=2704466 RepID=UPI0021CFA312|nr:peptide-methionine (R)-S-oxide reductase [Pontibacter burrus]
MLRWKDVIYYAKYGNPEPYRRVEHTVQEWKLFLNPEQYRVMRKGGTESPYRNAYCKVYDPGTYMCAGCGSLLFNAAAKYQAISGWPSFKQPASKGA